MATSASRDELLMDLKEEPKTAKWLNGGPALVKGLFAVVVLLFLVVVGLLIGLAVVIDDKVQQQDVCLSDECTLVASRVLQSMDRSVNPCDDFYTYVCGSWRKTHVIPEDRSTMTVFGVLRDEIQLITKNLLEDVDNVGVNETAWEKAKDMYASCVNTDLIEEKNVSVVYPVMQELGGWPVLGDNPGGNWSEANFDLVSLLVKLMSYGNYPIIDMWTGVDNKNSTQHILKLDQADFVLPGRKYYVEDTEKFRKMRKALVEFATALAVQFGADKDTARTEMEDVLAFETELANITMRSEDRRDSEALYNKMTIEDLSVNFTEPKPSDPIQFNWSRYVSGIMGLEGVDTPVNDTEPIVVKAVPYFEKLFDVLQKYSKRTIANHLVWRFMNNRARNLPSRFKTLKDDFKKVVYGTKKARPRWRECESYTVTQMGSVIGQKFVKQEFDETAKDSALEMIGEIRSAFNELLNDADWMDDHTKHLARDKAEAIRNWIGYPDSVLDTEYLNEKYENITIDKNEYFKNVLNNLKHTAIDWLDDLRKPYNKTIWKSTPTTVNAHYSPIKNAIIFPAGILQPPYFSKHQPKSLNYGSIGMIIGHEITHGFDDRGRQYNKEGDLEQWWEQKIIDNFNDKAKCIVDQYGKFLVPEANMTLNGINTQGENIADNGGLKQSYKAYRNWVKKQGKEEPKLPGLDFTHDQLFFIGFAQIWCANMKQEAAIKYVKTGVHSTGQFRVTGTLQNSADFARAFSCPRNSYLNPDKKCSLW